MKIRFIPLTFCLILAGAASAHRLPATVTPDHYSLWFAPDLNTETFRGRATINVTVAARSEEHTLNSSHT